MFEIGTVVRIASNKKLYNGMIGKVVKRLMPYGQEAVYEIETPVGIEAFMESELSAT